MHTRALALALLIVVPLAGCSSGGGSAKATATSPSSTAAATRATTARTSGATVHFEMDAVPAVPEQKCGAPKLCVLLATETGAVSGDLRGTFFRGNATAFGKQAHFVVGTAGVFRGTVKGCGTGTLVLFGTETADIHEGRGDWRIAEGFGSGDLTSVTGEGTGTGTVSKTGGFHSQWQGVLDCGK